MTDIDPIALEAAAKANYDYARGCAEGGLTWKELGRPTQITWIRAQEASLTVYFANLRGRGMLRDGCAYASNEGVVWTAYDRTGVHYSDFPVTIIRKEPA